MVEAEDRVSSTSTSASAANAAAIADLLGGPIGTPDAVSRQRTAAGIWLLLGLGVVAAAVLVAPWLMEAFQAQRTSADLTDLPVHLVERRDLRITVTEEGSLVSDDNVDITCDVAGGGDHH